MPRTARPARARTPERTAPPARLPHAMIAVFGAFVALQVPAFLRSWAYGWDESVYWSMRTYLVTGGRHGLVEGLRTLGFPLLLVPFPTLLAARVFVLACALACLWLCHRIAARRLPGPWALGPPALLALFAPFFGTAAAILSEVPALALHLGAVLALLERRHRLAGALAMLASLVRLQFAVYLPVLVLAMLVLERGAAARALGRAALGAVFALPVALLQLWAYRAEAGGDPLRALLLPVIEQLQGSAASPHLWRYLHPPGYFVAYLLAWSWLVVFVPVAWWRARRALGAPRPADREPAVFALLGAVALAYLLLSPRKEYRYLLLVAPWLALATVAGVHAVVQRLAGRRAVPAWAAALVVALVVATALPGLPAQLAVSPGRSRDYYDRFLGALEHVPDGATVLASTPMLRTPGRIVIGYYHNAQFLERLRARRYDYVSFTPGSFPCRAGDAACAELQARTLAYLNAHYTVWREAGAESPADVIYAAR